MYTIFKNISSFHNTSIFAQNNLKQNFSKTQLVNGVQPWCSGLKFMLTWTISAPKLRIVHYKPKNQGCSTFTSWVFLQICILSTLGSTGEVLKPSSNPDTSIYSVNGNPISTTLQHKDLRISFSADFNWIEH